MLTREATNVNFSVFDFTRQAIEPLTIRTQNEHYTTRHVFVKKGRNKLSYKTSYPNLFYYNGI